MPVCQLRSLSLTISHSGFTHPYFRPQQTPMFWLVCCVLAETVLIAHRQKSMLDFTLVQDNWKIKINKLFQSTQWYVGQMCYRVLSLTIHSNMCIFSHPHGFRIIMGCPLLDGESSLLYIFLISSSSACRFRSIAVLTYQQQKFLIMVLRFTALCASNMNLLCYLFICIHVIAYHLSFGIRNLDSKESITKRITCTY